MTNRFGRGQVCAALWVCLSAGLFRQADLPGLARDQAFPKHLVNRERGEVNSGGAATEIEFLLGRLASREAAATVDGTDFALYPDCSGGLRTKGSQWRPAVQADVRRLIFFAGA